MTANKPTDYLSINVNGEAKEIFMSGGLLRQLAAYLGDLNDFSGVYANAELQNILVVEALKPRSKRGQPVDNDYTIDDFDLSIDDTDRLITWITEHSLHFFVRNLTQARALGENNQEVVTHLQTLMQSVNGSSDSTEPSVSAGPTESVPAN